MGHDCATKLFYEGDLDYASNKLDDPFLKSLADGGLQIGALAQLYFPGGIEIKEIDHDTAVAKTVEALQHDEIILFEAAFRYQNLFVRVDILKKKGSFIELIEVKAKSYKKDEISFFNKAKDGFDGKWESYIGDIAFQIFVTKKSFPDFTFTSALMLANKGSFATVDKLHQKFLLKNQNGRTTVEIPPDTTLKDLGAEILIAVPTNDEVKFFLEQSYDGKEFSNYVNDLSAVCADRKWVQPKISRACGACEFKVDRATLGTRKSGFEQCWTSATSLKESDFVEPLIFDLWSLDFRIKDRLLSESRYFLTEVELDDLIPKTKTSKVLPRFERQWRQVELYRNKEKRPYFDREGFSSEISTWKYPLHFIDFETITSAIPFTKGLTPYETVAFQFSHHQVDQNGGVHHQDQFLSSAPAEFPNFNFVRALQKALGQDRGTVLRYASHENTVLNHIKWQLEKSAEADRYDLIEFINDLTIEKNSNKIIRSGNRKMVDLLELVKSLYLSPRMGGSNSIKSVLPAVLFESQFLHNKYSKPIYGAEIKSYNFKNKIWCEKIEGEIKDPYKTLEPIFHDVPAPTLALLDRMADFDDIREGGSASMAYARMQLTQMSDQERKYIADALLKYCELDTLAMVMIYEYWMDLIS